jgi:hypothetical protein
MIALAYYWRLLSEGCLTWVSVGGTSDVNRCIYQHWTAVWLAVPW